MPSTVAEKIAELQAEKNRVVVFERENREDCNPANTDRLHSQIHLVSRLEKELSALKYTGGWYVHPAAP